MGSERDDGEETGPMAARRKALAKALARSDQMRQAKHARPEVQKWARDTRKAAALRKTSGLESGDSHHTHSLKREGQGRDKRRNSNQLASSKYMY